ncbi:MAG: acetyl-CoA carboxylase, carboxyltransferase subunit beta [Bacillota bacterium]
MSRMPGQEGMPVKKNEGIPEGLWMRCPDCGDMLFRKVVEESLHVCPDCQYHFRISARVRIEQLVDPGSFEEMFTDILPTDPLNFVDRKSYADRLRDEQAKSGNTDGVICGKGFIKGRPLMMAAMDPMFMMGSMGSVVGEKITRTIETAMDEKLPLLIVSCSGGARMQESTLSLMQMAKTSAALARFDEAGGLFISLLADPTTGGVTASFAMLGDFIIAEPKALIGFAGPRTIWNTIKVELPEGFQRSEFLQEHGFIDFVVHRKDLRSEIARLVDYCGK